MTVTYTLEVSQVRFINLVKLLFRWRGSVYKLMFKELLSFLFAYYLIACTYRYALDDTGKRRFENFSTYCREFLSVVPVTFILGFYLSFVATRWWNQYLAIPWPDKLAIEISAYIQGSDERGRMIRRSLVRYLNLISCLTFQYTSTVIKKRFPTLDHLVSAGIMTKEEKVTLESTPTQHGLWWIPAQWFSQLIMLARKEGRIHDDLHVKTLIDSLTEYRSLAGTVWSFDWISVPLSYTQVVAIAVYSFFVSCLFGRQYLYNSVGSQNEIYDVDFYIPVFTIFQFLFYVGWLKVGEAMICPFGEDDDDFDLNWIIDRNIQVGYLIVDQMYRRGPKPQKDALWDEIEAELPYTNAAYAYKSAPFFGSTQGMNVSEKQSEWTAEQPQMPPIDEEAAIGFRDPATSFNNKVRRRLQPQKRNVNTNSLDSPKEEQINESDNESLHSSEDEVEDDNRSNSSIQYDEEKSNRGRLPGLIMGVSRHTLGSRAGSKQSLNSRLSRKRSSTSKFSFQRSPPSSMIQTKSIPSSHQRLNKMRKSRGSSPVIFQHRDGIPDHVLEENKNHSLNKPIEEKSPKENEQTAENNHVDEIDKTVETFRPMSLEFRNRSDTGNSTEDHKIVIDSTSRTPLIPVEEETR